MGVRGRTGWVLCEGVSVSWLLLFAQVCTPRMLKEPMPPRVGANLTA